MEAIWILEDAKEDAIGSIEEQEITQEVINESMESLLGGATEPEIVRAVA